MSFTADLTLGLARYLAARGVGTLREDSGYLDTETAIVELALPQRPDRAVAIHPYQLSDDASLSDSVIGVQFRIRGTTDPDSANSTGDALFDVLHGAYGVDLTTGVRVLQALRRSGAPAGTDDVGRWNRIDNYYLTVFRPSQNRT